jgi:hypothetical protein
MTVTIAPFTVNPDYEPKAPIVGYEEDIMDERLPITYWGIYLDDKYVSHTSSKEQAERTKVW